MNAEEQKIDAIIKEFTTNVGEAFFRLLHSKGLEKSFTLQDMDSCKPFQNAMAMAKNKAKIDISILLNSRKH